MDPRRRRVASYKAELVIEKCRIARISNFPAGRETILINRFLDCYFHRNRVMGEPLPQIMTRQLANDAWSWWGPADVCQTEPPGISQKPELVTFVSLTPSQSFTLQFINNKANCMRLLIETTCMLSLT